MERRERPQPTPELSFPSSKELEEMESQNLHAIWRKNHESFLQFLKDKGNDVPYFGLHGTSKTSLEEIKKTKSVLLEVASFFQRPKPENFIADLYALCGYPAAYAFRLDRVKKDPGGIMIFKLEDNGKNIASELEPLKGTAPALGIMLNFDNPKEQELVSAMGLHDKRGSATPFPARAELIINPQNFDHLFKGAYLHSQAEKYLDFTNLDMSKVILARRFLAQDILNTALKQLGMY